MQNVTIIRNGTIIDKKVETEFLKIENPFRKLSWFENKFLAILYRVNCPVCKNLYNNKLKNINTDLIIVFDGGIRKEFLFWLKKHNTNCKIILWYWNTQEEMKNKLNFMCIPAEIEVWTYSMYDAEKYGLYYNTTFYPYEEMKDEYAIEYDVCFIGKDKGRIEKLVSLQKIFDYMQLKTMFWIVSTHKYALKNKKLYRRQLPYQIVDKFITCSRAILDLSVSETAGPTFRTMEAIFKEKKLITDNLQLEKEDFYRKENIFLLGKDDIETLPDFINSSYEILPEWIKKKYQMGKWIERFDDKNWWRKK